MAGADRACVTLQPRRSSPTKSTMTASRQTCGQRASCSTSCSSASESTLRFGVSLHVLLHKRGCHPCFGTPRCSSTRAVWMFHDGTSGCLCIRYPFERPSDRNDHRRFQKILQRILKVRPARCLSLDPTLLHSFPVMRTAQTSLNSHRSAGGLHLPAQRHCVARVQGPAGQDPDRQPRQADHGAADPAAPLVPKGVAACFARVVWLHQSPRG